MMGNRERARSRALWAALLKRESSPSFASLLEFLKVILGTCSLCPYCGSEGGEGIGKHILRAEAALHTEGRPSESPRAAVLQLELATCIYKSSKYGT